MRKLLYIICTVIGCVIVLVIIGCGIYGCGNDNISDTSLINNHGFGFEYDDEFNGLRVRYADGGPHEPIAETIETWFQETIECADTIGPAERAGLPVPPPFVIIVQIIDDENIGRTFLDDTGTVLITRKFSDIEDLYVHEFVHWMLYKRFVPFARNNDHDIHNREPEFNCAFMN